MLGRHGSKGTTESWTQCAKTQVGMNEFACSVHTCARVWMCVYSDPRAHGTSGHGGKNHRSRDWSNDSKVKNTSYSSREHRFNL